MILKRLEPLHRYIVEHHESVSSEEGGKPMKQTSGIVFAIITDSSSAFVEILWIFIKCYIIMATISMFITVAFQTFVSVIGVTFTKRFVVVKRLAFKALQERKQLTFHVEYIWLWKIQLAKTFLPTKIMYFIVCSKCILNNTLFATLAMYTLYCLRLLWQVLLRYVLRYYQLKKNIQTANKIQLQGNKECKEAFVYFVLMLTLLKNSQVVCFFFHCLYTCNDCCYTFKGLQYLGAMHQPLTCMTLMATRIRSSLKTARLGKTSGTGCARTVYL